MDTFDFPYHMVEDEYPTSSATMKFGGGYEFASKPRGPDQIKFNLSFPGMWFYESSPGVLDNTSNPQINMQTLIEFYEAHRLYEKFNYAHPRRGIIVCRFHQPLKVPKGIVNGSGQVQAFTVNLISQP